MKSVLSACKVEVDAALTCFPWHDRRAYGDWLAQTYYYVRHSTRLLAAAAARFAHDERSTLLHQRFGKHIGEEERHELLALHDLTALGLSIDEFEERDATRMFYEPQYYKVEHQDPLALFGYILMLETAAASNGGFILSCTDPLYGRAAGTFLRVHAEDDVEHVERAFTALAGISLEQERIVTQSLRQSASAYLSLLGVLAQSYTTSPGVRAA